MLQKHKPSHECGVFAVFGHPDAALLTYYGLFALQHRGQESAGIVSAKGSDSPFHLHKEMGLVSQVFKGDTLEKLEGTRAIGHDALLDDRIEHGQERTAFRGRHGARAARHRA